LSLDQEHDGLFHQTANQLRLRLLAQGITHFLLRAAALLFMALVLMQNQ